MGENCFLPWIFLHPLLHSWVIWSWLLLTRGPVTILQCEPATEIPAMVCESVSLLSYSIYNSYPMQFGLIKGIIFLCKSCFFNYHNLTIKYPLNVCFFFSHPYKLQHKWTHITQNSIIKQWRINYLYFLYTYFKNSLILVFAFQTCQQWQQKLTDVTTL